MIIFLIIYFAVIIGAIVYGVQRDPYFCNLVIGMKMGYSSKQRAVIYAQMQYETANFTSNIYLKAHNVCGMGVATSRVQNKTGTITGDGGRVMATFANVWRGVEDLYVWLALNMPVKSVADTTATYAAYLKGRNFFTADLKTYAEGLEYYKSQPNMRQTAWLVFAICVILAPVLFFTLRPKHRFARLRKRVKRAAGRVRQRTVTMYRTAGGYFKRKAA